MSKKYAYKIYFLFILAFGLLAITAPSSYAQSRSKAFSPEEVAIAYYKSGDVVPNFEKWIKDRDPYKHTAWAKRVKVYEEELARLALAYQQYDPKNDFIIVRTTANLEPKKVLRETNEDLQEGEEQYDYFLNAKFTSAPDALYFPYDFLKERIILMPYQLTDVMNSPITKQTYDRLFEKRSQRKKLTTIFRLKPDEADFSQPYMIDGLEQWVFKTRIATVEFWSTSGSLVYERSADWYLSPNTVNLRELYEERPTGSQFKKGTPKPVTIFDKEK